MLKSLGSKFLSRSSRRTATPAFLKNTRSTVGGSRTTDTVTFGSGSAKEAKPLPTQAGWMTLGAMAGLAAGFVAGAAIGIPGLALVGGIGLAVAGAVGAGKVADKVQGIERPPLTEAQKRAQTERLMDYIDEQNRKLQEDFLIFG